MKHFLQWNIFYNTALTEDLLITNNKLEARIYIVNIQEGSHSHFSKKKDLIFFIFLYAMVADNQIKHVNIKLYFKA